MGDNIITKIEGAWNRWHEKNRAEGILEHHGILNAVYIRQRINPENNHVIIVYKHAGSDEELELDAGLNV